MIDLDTLLAAVNIPPQSVLVLRNRPSEPELRQVLPWFAEEHPDLFNAYQRVQNEQAEAAMSKADYVASFIAHGPGRALFVGLYRQAGAQPIMAEAFWRIAEYQTLRRHGMSFTCERPGQLHFDLVPINSYSAWKGRLIVDWPGLARAWYRWGDRNVFPVHAVLEDSALARAMPPWDEIVLDWEQLQVLPMRWQAALAQWRGIYLVTDISDGKAYVGSAAGSENILGRWRNYAESGHGENKRLRDRAPQNFRFTILERLSPDMTLDLVVQREASWKERLHTRTLGLNEN